jgi:hypothetical protein
VTAAPKGKDQKSPSVLIQEPPEPLSPSVVLGPSEKPAEGPPVVVTSEKPPQPQSGPPVAAAPAAPPAPSPPVLASPPPSQPEAPVTLGNGFTERTSKREIPEIHIVNMTGFPATLTLADGDTRFRWQIDQQVHYSIPPGTYVFRLYHAIYQATGRPDMVGTITCRRYKNYDCEIFWRNGLDTRYGKIGDKD